MVSAALERFLDKAGVLSAAVAGLGGKALVLAAEIGDKAVVVCAALGLGGKAVGAVVSNTPPVIETWGTVVGAAPILPGTPSAEALTLSTAVAAEAPILGMAV